MSFLEAFILGIVQGLTEFLPVSSSGHLELAKFILGQNMSGEESLFMTVVLHVATCLSTIVVFRKDLVEIFSGLLQMENNESFQFSLKIVISMIPAALVGLFLDDFIENFFSGKLYVVCSFLLLTALLLLLADKAKVTEKRVGKVDAFIIGLAQMIAILPGISRSGATISTAVLLGIDREKAARFSFLMVIPLILGAMAKKTMEDDFTMEGVSIATLIVGFLSAFVAGFIACKWMIALVKRAKLKYFAVYCAIVGSVGLIYLFLQ